MKKGLVVSILILSQLQAVEIECCDFASQIDLIDLVNPKEKLVQQPSTPMSHIYLNIYSQDGTLAQLSFKDLNSTQEIEISHFKNGEYQVGHVKEDDLEKLLLNMITQGRLKMLILTGKDSSTLLFKQNSIDRDDIQDISKLILKEL